MRIIFGLGNPGPRYALTRHNAGWLAVDNFAYSSGFPDFKVRSSALITGPKDIQGEKVLIVKPLTYMNRSGLAVKAFCDHYGISNDEMIVVYDDIALRFGRLRLRQQGSAGGHNGLRSVISFLGTDEFPRLRIGIRPEHEVRDLVDFVLDPFTEKELVIFESVLKGVSDGLRSWLAMDIQCAMSVINSADLMI